MKREDVLLEALKKYGRHTTSCALGTRLDKMGCTCGLSSTLAAIEAEVQQEPGLGDDVPCEICGGSLDTGLDCTECNHDNWQAVYGTPRPHGRARGQEPPR